MGHRQILVVSIAMAVMSLSLFAYYGVKWYSSKPLSVAVQINKNSPSLRESQVATAQVATAQVEPAQVDPAPMVENESLNQIVPEEMTQEIAWRTSSHGFVGSDACVNCHKKLVDSYKKHPMYWGSTRLISEDRNPPASSESFIHGKKRILSSETLSSKISGSAIVHHELMYDAEGQLIYDDAVEQKYVIGSGRRAKAYVHEQQGVLCLSPLNWFGKENRWGFNPGYTPDDPRRFDRRANIICLQCHSGKLNPVEHGSEFLEERPFDEMVIGCEKCHGPGAEHISFHNAPDSDAKDPIVNPKRLDKFRQASVCYQCHLQPATARILRPGRSHVDFRPGMRLDDVWIVMNAGGTVDAEGKTDSVRQVQQMMESQCYVNSPNMSCTSCHDPHEVPEENQRIKFFRDRCVACHTDLNPCSGASDERPAVADSCIDCHMPKLGLVSTAHVSQTDHRIVRNKSILSRDRSRVVNQFEFVFKETHQLPDLEKRRALAIVSVKNGVASNELVEELQVLRTHFPQDGFLALALGGVSVSRKDYTTALKSFQDAAASPQTTELALETLTQITYFAQDWPSAFKAFELSLRLNPRRSQTLAIKADALFRTGQIQPSIDTAQEALKYNPSLIEVHQWLRDTYKELGRIQESDAERLAVERIMQARPPTNGLK